MKKRKKTASQYHTRRYYLHRVLRSQFKIDAKNREIDISPYRSAADIPVPYRWYVGQLIKHGYNAQLKLL